MSRRAACFDQVMTDMQRQGDADALIGLETESWSSNVGAMIMETRKYKLDATFQNATAVLERFASVILLPQFGTVTV